MATLAVVAGLLMIQSSARGQGASWIGQPVGYPNYFLGNPGIFTEWVNSANYAGLQPYIYITQNGSPNQYAMVYSGTTQNAGTLYSVWTFVPPAQLAPGAFTYYFNGTDNNGTFATDNNGGAGWPGTAPAPISGNISVYLSPTPPGPGQTGTAGTITDPLDASTPDKFDSIMLDYYLNNTTNLSFVLSSGTYYTCGQGLENWQSGLITSRWNCLAGWGFYGSGINNTVLKLSVNGINYGQLLTPTAPTEVYMLGGVGGGIEFEDLTVNGSWDQLQSTLQQSFTVPPSTSGLSSTTIQVSSDEWAQVNGYVSVQRSDTGKYEGTFLITQVVDGTHITIENVGQYFSVTPAAGDTVPAGATYVGPQRITSAIMVSGSDCTFERVHITNTGATIYENNIGIFIGAGGNFEAKTTGETVSECVLDNLWGAWGWTITLACGNSVNGANTGNYISGDIEGNAIYSDGYNDGLGLWGTGESVYSGNIVENCSRGLGGDVPYDTDIQITNNVFTNDQWGIYIGGSTPEGYSRLNISDNRISLPPGGVGILLIGGICDSIIANNYITSLSQSSPGGFGFDVYQEASGTSGSNSFSNNIVTSELPNGIDPAYGIAFGNSDQNGNPLSIWNPGAPNLATMDQAVRDNGTNSFTGSNTFAGATTFSGNSNFALGMSTTGGTNTFSNVSNFVGVLNSSGLASFNAGINASSLLVSNAYPAAIITATSSQGNSYLILESGTAGYETGIGFNTEANSTGQKNMRLMNNQNSLHVDLMQDSGGGVALGGIGYFFPDGDVQMGAGGVTFATQGASQTASLNNIVFAPNAIQIGSDFSGYGFSITGGVPGGSGSNSGGEVWLGGPTRGDNAVNAIIFSQNSKEVGRFQNGGNFGIGTSNPQYTLDISGTTRTGDLITSQVGSSFSGYDSSIVGGVPGSSSGNLGGEVRVGGPTRGDNAVNGIIFYQNGTEIGRFNNGGNFGLGTTNPQYNLDVSGSTRISGNLIVNGAILGTGTAGVTYSGPAVFDTTATFDGTPAFTSGSINLNGSSSAAINFSNNQTNEWNLTTALVSGSDYGLNFYNSQTSSSALSIDGINNNISGIGRISIQNLKQQNGSPNAGGSNAGWTGSIGDLYQETNGTPGSTLWVKESGINNNTGWNSVVTMTGPIAGATILTGSTVITTGTWSANSMTSYPVSVPNSTVGDGVMVGIPVTTSTLNVICDGYVTTTGTVSMRIHNATAAAIKSGTGTYIITVIHL